MGRITRGWLAGSAVLLSLNIADAESVTPHDALIVRVYNSAGVSRDNLAAARRVADAIFRRAGIRPQWRECRTAAGPSAASADPCADVLRPREIVARLVSRGDLPGTMLGYALVDEMAGTGTLATVFVDRVNIAAGRLRVPHPTLLGRTLAHELGHLLLGSNSHAVHGLMRPWWSDLTLRRDVEREWRFSDGEARQIGAVLAARGRLEPVL